MQKPRFGALRCEWTGFWKLWWWSWMKEWFFSFGNLQCVRDLRKHKGGPFPQRRTNQKNLQDDLNPRITRLSFQMNPWGEATKASVSPEEIEPEKAFDFPKVEAEQEKAAGPPQMEEDPEESSTWEAKTEVLNNSGCEDEPQESSASPEYEEPEGGSGSSELDVEVSVTPESKGEPSAPALWGARRCSSYRPHPEEAPHLTIWESQGHLQVLLFTGTVLKIPHNNRYEDNQLLVLIKHVKALLPALLPHVEERPDVGGHLRCRFRRSRIRNLWMFWRLWLQVGQWRKMTGNVSITLKRGKLSFYYQNHFNGASQNFLFDNIITLFPG